ncbi:MAG: DUF4129 domain-containing protein [Micrococcus sp.]|nr:DUF4129 domain-containing protein [Micrococcus sp.]
MRSTGWTPNDDEARRLLTERIDSYDIDGSLSLWERFIRWINEALTLNVDSSGAGSVVIVVLLAAAVAVLLFLLIRYFRPSVSPAAIEESQLVDSSIAAEEYFDSAKRYLASGELDQAYIHAYRSIVRNAQQRQLVEVTPSTTATTFGWTMGAVLPHHRDAIDEASSGFNRVVYGSMTPTRDAVATVMQLAHSLQTAQPQAYNPHNDPARLIPR